MFILYLRMINGVARSEKRDIYVSLMVVGMVYLAVDALWGAIYDDLLPIPRVVQLIIYAVYYSTSAVLSYKWFAYAEYMQDSIFNRIPAIRNIVKIPMCIVVVLAVASIWTKSFFYIDDQGNYCRGDLYVFQLALTYGYILFSGIKIIFRLLITAEFEKQNTHLVMLSYFVFPVVFGALQITAPEMPYLCVGIALASFQTYLFNVNFEKERDRSTSKINSLGRLFISAYYMNLQTGHREYMNDEVEKLDSYLTGDFHNTAPEEYEAAVHTYVSMYVHREDRELYRTMCDIDYMRRHLNAENRFYFFNYRQVVGDVEKWYRMHIIASLFTPEGEVSHVVAAVMDVDKQVRADISQQEAIEEALIEAENANKAKSVFLSNMSHDIRTPMNAITGFATLAKTHIDDKELIKNYLDKISSASTHLLSLINDILDMSRIENGKIQIEESEVALPEVVEEIQDLIQPMAEEKGLTFVIESDVRDNYIYCDKLRLNQILINLLGNAVKFTSDGGNVTLNIHQELESPAGYGVYIFSVRDTGIGVAPEFLDRIFQAFEREKTSTMTGIQGTGLGLAITKSMVELMGGKITVNSELGKGTEFVVKLVFTLQDLDDAELERRARELDKEAQDSLQKEKMRQLFAGKKLLLVEDNELNREIARMLLKEEGLIVEEACNGREAVEMVENSWVGEYQLVLMDIQMPVLDGYEATKQIRALANRELANIPIVAMTANAFEEERRKALECGMNGHIAKPIDVAVLFNTIQQILIAND